MDNLLVDRIDPQGETERYRQRVLQTKTRIWMHRQERCRKRIYVRLVPKKIAVFQAFSRIIREVIKQMDSHSIARYMAPTMQPQNPRQIKILLVTLTEMTPVQEAAGLQNDLRRAGIEPWAWIVNNSIAATTVQSPLLSQRAHNELADIEAVPTLHAKRYAVVPLLKEEPVGIEKLLALSKCSTIKR